MFAHCKNVTILLIDHDEAFRTGLGTILREDGHGVLEFNDPGEVPPLTELGTVDLAISDCTEHERHGLAFAADFHNARPDVPVILLTTYDADDHGVGGVWYGRVRMLPKPVDYEAFHTLIHELVGEPRRAKRKASRSRRAKH